MKEEIAKKFSDIQNSICEGLEHLDTIGKFVEDQWQRTGGGGGKSRVIQGLHIEKGGVNFSEVFGRLPSNIAESLTIQASDFYATGLSIVLHPKNPMVPIIHMNVRYFETEGGNWWFGGGIDLTPHYINEYDAREFHSSLKTVCDKYHPEFYGEFKNWADEYFFIKHRGESRGIGGIFFDRLNENRGMKKQDILNFVCDVALAFVPIYRSIFLRNINLDYGDKETRWQSLRRGRYVEFNLVWDRGTKFGLVTNGRTESILMSLPPRSAWEYNYTPQEGSEEFKTQELLKKNMDWVNYTAR